MTENKVTIEQFIAAKEALDKARVPSDGRFVKVHPSWYTNQGYTREDFIELLREAGFKLVEIDD